MMMCNYKYFLTQNKYLVYSYFSIFIIVYLSNYPAIHKNQKLTVLHLLCKLKNIHVLQNKDIKAVLLIQGKYLLKFRKPQTGFKCFKNSGMDKG